MTSSSIHKNGKTIKRENKEKAMTKKKKSTRKPAAQKETKQTNTYQARMSKLPKAKRVESR